METKTKYVEIKEENAEKIMKVFNEVQGRSSTRMVNSFKDVTDLVDSVEKRIRGITKKAKEGTTADEKFQQQFPNAYKHRPMSTHYTIIFKNGKWKIDLNSIERATCPNNSKYYSYNLNLSDSAKEAILALYK